MSSNQEQVTAEEIQLRLVQRMREHREVAFTKFKLTHGHCSYIERGTFEAGFQEAWMQQQETINILNECIAETARFLRVNATEFMAASIALQGLADCE